ncbi:hypothetical protein ACFUJR_31815 [Streptomyces sp. NPDC057271]|uniref:hypothetical protein n=1 Tax=unclassified Streptomyces TaxID=2593676 RepID=UPI003644B0D4
MRARAIHAAAVVLPLLVGAVGCQAAGGSDPEQTRPGASSTPKPVSAEPIDRQLFAATTATAAGGSSRFTSTIMYGSAKSTAVDRVTGVQDYAKTTARVRRVLDIPRSFPEDAAAFLGRRPGAPSEPEIYAVSGNDISYRTRAGSWLRYSASSSKDFADLVEDLLEHTGDAAPWGRTLAEVVKRSEATRQPVTTGDGDRRYELTVSPATAASGLPATLDDAIHSETAGQVPLTVVLDEHGRLVRVEADYTSLLKGLQKDGVLKGVTSLRAEYTLTGHGATPVPPLPEGEKNEDAETALVEVGAMEPGGCASTDTGLDRMVLVRSAPCDAAADLLVFGQVDIDETVDGDPDGVADRLAERGCDRKFDAAPASWTSRSRPSGTYYRVGSETLSVGSETTLTGRYTCYIRTSTR